ncbi:MAG: winged helix-turn-helix domain-containing protein [Chloroflexi bacterium]|nr:winged helix-turn-helix domain-containing protein [Chloroflexota bacterium]
MIELHFPDAVLDDADFCNRHLERSQIEQAFQAAASRPIVILGERRIGKTSLLNVTLNWLQAQERYQVVTPGPWSSMHGFKSELITALALAAGLNPRREDWTDAAGNLQLNSATELVQACHAICAAARQRLVVCIDEFDSALLACPTTGEQREIQALVLHFVEKARLPLTFFFSMTRPTEKIGHAYPTSFLNKARQIDLHPFGKADMIAAVSSLVRDLVQFTVGGLDQLFDLSGGHPYFFKAILNSLLNSAMPHSAGAHIDRAELEPAVTEALHSSEIRLTLPNLLEAHCTEQERALLMRLAQSNDLILSGVSEQEAAAARALRQRDYVSCAPDGRGPIGLSIGFIGRWLRLQSTTGEYVISAEPTRQPLPDGILIDEESRRIYRDGHELELTRLELQLLLYMGQHLDRVLERRELGEHAWGAFDDVLDGARLDQAIGRLRKKLRDDARHPKYIQTYPGTGYRLSNVRFRPR